MNCWGGYFNIYIQRNYFDSEIAVWIYATVILTQLFKFFFFFRIWDRYCVITIMILKCIYDLRVFMLFFVLMVVFFGMALNVLSLNPQQEYESLSQPIKGIFSALRISVGDFDFTQMEKLTASE